MDEKGIIEKIFQKKEFKDLPSLDVSLVYNFVKSRYDFQEEIIKESRNLLRKMYTVFVSEKLLNSKEKDFEWFLKKHISTKERFDYYSELYSKIFEEEKYSVYDLGCGINGFSYNFFPKKINYFSYEAVGQLVDLQNKYFRESKISGICVKKSLFDLEEVKKFILQGTGKKVVFLFKVLDSLEMLKRDYSKDLIKEITPLVDKVVISFATRSLVSKKSFRVQRKWLTDFLKENYLILDEFEFGVEKYIIFSKK